MAVTAESVIGVVAAGYLADARLAAALEIATATVQVRCFDSPEYETAVAHYALHLLVMGDRSAAAEGGAMVSGDVTSQSDHSLSRSYGSAAASSTGALDSTVWGRMYQEALRNSRCGVPEWYP